MLPSIFLLELLLIIAQVFLSQGFETVITEQDATSLRPGRLFVQLVTEPRSLIRLFESLDLSFQVFRHWGRTGSAILRLPFDNDILNSKHDPIGLDYWKRPFYARMPTRFPAEAPRYVRMPPS